MTVDTNRDFKILKALLSTDRNGASLDISQVITDIDIYEELDKPYLTADITFLDTESVVQNLDIQGVEKLELSIQSPHTKNIINKTFRITKISQAIRSGDRGEAVILAAVEEHAYISNALNVNKCYTGSPGSIIQSIADDYLDKTIVGDGDQFQEMKVIVPNLNPVEAMNWIRTRATNSDGMPYYLYSVLGDNNLRFKHLGSLLKSNPINQKNPYTYSAAPLQRETDLQYFAIQSYQYEDAENTSKLVSLGSVGGQHNFYDIANGYEYKVNFDVDKDVFQMINDRDYLNQNQTRYNFAPASMVKDLPLSQNMSRVVSTIASTGSYIGAGGFKSYEEEIDAGGHTKRVIGSALKKYIDKSPLTISVDGRPFIMGGHTTIGNTIKIRFNDSSVNSASNKIVMDRKKSGDYIIMAVRHTFKFERYDVTMKCSKIASYNKDEPVS